MKLPPGLTLSERLRALDEMIEAHERAMQRAVDLLKSGRASAAREHLVNALAAPTSHKGASR